VKNKTHVRKLKTQLKKEFVLKDLGVAKKILGMEIVGPKSHHSSFDDDQLM